MKAAFKARNVKAGFWCPPDIDGAIRDLVERGVYPDLSKAIVGLLRQGLLANKRLPSDLLGRVHELAASLQRHPDIIQRQCVEGILGMIDQEDQRAPLIVEEMRLRQRRGRT
jgi:hypothetical protein